ncbi:hypothetical protein QL996_02315 [Planococcus sp. APC 4015]|nr:hypothetical protein [Planococcus sp. APC 4015]
MRLSSRSDDRMPGAAASVDECERGSAALEFILAGMLLLVPVVYLIVALGLIQQQALGAEAGARHIARAVSTSADDDEARGRADAVIASVAAEYGLDPDSIDLTLSCVPAGADCPTAGATVVVTLRATVTLPFVPAVLGLDRVASVPIEASAAQRISRLWGSP